MNTHAPLTVMALSVKSEYLPRAVDLATLKDDYHTHAQVESVGIACAPVENSALKMTEPFPEVVAVSGEAFEPEDAQGTSAAHLSAVLNGIMDLRPGSVFVVHTPFAFKQLGGRYRMPLPPHIDIATLGRELFGLRKVSLPYLCEVYGVATASRPVVNLVSTDHTDEQIMDLAAWDAQAIIKVLGAMARDNRAVIPLIQAAAILRPAPHSPEMN